MKTTYEFDMVYDCQQIFRKVLTAFSNPGKIQDIGIYKEKLQCRNNTEVALSCMLLDNETSFFVEGDESLSEEICKWTNSPRKGLDNADYIFVPQIISKDRINDILTDVKKGILIDPHKSTIIFIRLDEIEPQVKASLKGPGIKEKQQVFLTEYAIHFIKIRDSLDIEYPCGIDLVFVTASGQIMAVPRKTAIEEA